MKHGPPVGKFQIPLEARFWKHVRKSDGCWEWTAATANRSRWSYGIIGISGSRKLMLAHRASWTIHHGPIPLGMWVLHRCDNPRCVRPAHLFLGTHTENMRDMTEKGHQANQNTYKSHCIRGHEFTDENIRWYRGTRNCRTCSRERMREVRKCV